MPRRPRRVRLHRPVLLGLPALLAVPALLGAASPADAGPDPRPAPGGLARAAAVRDGEVYDRFLVRYAEPGSASGRVAAAARRAGTEAAADRTLATGATLVRTQRPLPAPAARALLTALADDPGAEYAEPDVLLQPTALPSLVPADPRLREQWHYVEGTAGLNLPRAWDSADGAGVVVAVVDTGSSPHTDLATNLVAGYDFISNAAAARDGGGRDADPRDEGDWSAAGECGSSTSRPSSWHGTHVAGTVAAVWSNGRGGAGVAPRAKVQPVRALGKCGGYLSDIVDALVWAAGGSVPGVPANRTPARVVNMSLGGAGACSSTYQAGVNAAVARGSTVVVAAGNSNADVAGYQPASCSNVVTVAALDRAGNRAAYSNYGTRVDVAAPGGETSPRAGDGVLSTLNAGTTTPGAESYGLYQGTSMATPHVAGLAALLLGEKALTPAQVESTLKTTTRPVPGACAGGCGAGLVDAYSAVRAVNGIVATSYLENGTDYPVPDPGSAQSQIQVARAGSAPVNLLVGVDVKHPFRGDLVLDLLAPDGTAYRLKDSSASDGGAGLRTTYAVNASGEAAAGTWRLRVRDVYSGDTGYLDSWSLQF